MLVTVLGMLASGVPISDNEKDAVKYGAGQEPDFLSRYFTTAGGAPNKPIFVPFGSSGPSSWHNAYDYSTKTLQRIRRDVERDLFIHPSKETWTFKSGFANALAAMKQRFRDGSMSIAPIAVWFKRQQDVSSIQKAIDDTIAELNLAPLVGPFFTKDTNGYDGLALQATALTDADVAEIIGIAGPPPAPLARVQLEQKLCEYLTRKEQLSIDRSIVYEILNAWMVHDIVVLVGSPGTGKSSLAQGVARGLSSILGKSYVRTQTEHVTSAHEISTFIGYQNLEGNLVPSNFTTKFILDEASELQTCVLIMDEWNLAAIDTYFSSVLAAIEGDRSISLPGKTGVKDADPEDSQPEIPIDLFVIATCNSYLEEPETRLPISKPVKRRSTIITLPNLFAQKVYRDGVSKALEDVTAMFVAQEKDAVLARKEIKSMTQFDHFRAEALEHFEGYASFSDDLRTKIEEVVSLLLRLAAGRTYLTFAPLKDMLLSLLFAPPERRVETLAFKVTGKLLSLVTADLASLEPLATIFANTAGHSIVEAELSRVKAAAHELGSETSVPMV